MRVLSPKVDDIRNQLPLCKQIRVSKYMASYPVSHILVPRICSLESLNEVPGSRMKTYSKLIELQSWTIKACLFCGCGYSYLGHDRNNSRGSEMLENIYLECIEEIGTNRSS